MENPPSSSNYGNDYDGINKSVDEDIDQISDFEAFESDILSTLSLLFTIIMVTMCICGAVMNTLSLIIFTSASFRKRSINVLLAGLSASDLCLLILAIPVFSLSQIQKLIPGFSMQMTSRVLVYAYPVTLMAQTMSVWMLVSITVDRYLAVCHPFAVRIYCTVFWEYSINTSDDVSEDKIIVGRLRDDYWYMVLYQNIATLITQFVLPLVVLCILNLQVARTILEAGETRRELVASEKREHSTAKMMLFVVIGKYRAHLRTMYGISFFVSRCCFWNNSVLSAKPRSAEYTTLSGFSTKQAYSGNGPSSSKNSDLSRKY
ncbi:hypothetical protein FO519_000124 [Halicephalobus sp. NKZ332]|nr:hypothetical protein FO519_000124 [Halicephalobus sp. NKZ332]